MFRIFLIIGISMLTWAVWFNYASDAPTTIQEMKLVCAKEAALNNASAEDKEYMSQCVEDTGKSVAVLAMIWLFVIAIGVVITALSFWRLMKTRNATSVSSR